MKRKKITYFDKNIKRKSKLVKDTLNYFPTTKIPLPSVVEISDSGTCNRLCSFCPRSDSEYENKKIFIDRALHNKLIKELSEVKFSGLLGYSGFNEPLLNKSIYQNIKFSRSLLPNAKIELTTNGDVLNEERLKMLFDNGLTTILISAYDGHEQAKNFLALCNKVNLKKEQFVIRHRYLPPEKNFGITLSNRGGMLKNATFKINPLTQPLNNKCNYPSYTFFMDYNGDVLMCSHDWGKKNILGNLNKNSFYEIWTSKKSELARKKLINANRHFSPCNVCDAHGELIGNNHSKAWKNFYNEKK